MFLRRGALLHVVGHPHLRVVVRLLPLVVVVVILLHALLLEVRHVRARDDLVARHHARLQRRPLDVRALLL